MTDSSVFLEYAQTVRGEIDQALSDYSQYPSEDCPPRLQEAIRYSLLAKGKRLRPILTLMAAEACGKEKRLALPAACAVEMIHTYSLIHDDLPAMDDDDLRRGQPTCHVQFDEAAAILAGDALLTQAFEVLANDLPAKAAAGCCLELSRAAGCRGMVGGQADDLAAETGEHRDLQRLENIHRRKTGALFRASLLLGGLATEADSESLRRLEEYGRKLGLAFQIVDDLLDIQGERATLGKSIGKDQQQNKLTFPALLGVEESQRRAAELLEQARKAVAPMGEPARPLQSLAFYVLERNR